jgi:subtilisin family serine protease
LSGTSMASPTVAGAAALVWSYLGSSASNAAVRSALETNADPVGALGQNELAWTAHGRLNAFKALADAVGTAPPPPAADGIHVGDLDGTSTASGPNWQARVVVRVHDQTESLVANAAVMGRWSGGFSGNVSCTTDGTGQCAFDTGAMPKRNAQVTFEVTGLSGTQSYQPTANHDPDGDSDGRTITVVK